MNESQSILKFDFPPGIFTDFCQYGLDPMNCIKLQRNMSWSTLISHEGVLQKNNLPMIFKEISRSKYDLDHWNAGSFDTWLSIFKIALKNCKIRLIYFCSGLLNLIQPIHHDKQIQLTFISSIYYKEEKIEVLVISKEERKKLRN